MVQLHRILIVLCVAFCHLLLASAQFDGLEDNFFLRAEDPPQPPRDPRENRGPVVFPATQPGGGSSGVIVGASGFGFVPPGGNKRPRPQSIFTFW
ncbi:uncharacterized protein LOC126838693 [Adelges cooleyi]|uniref:uncharacterized protein LOC126838693 n=1 Tax=Adelges cooleyi TaxID=133065 RepID=UPI0021802833|nr:uncharacterized protein LOC126838693 [Adelges cooleyi]